MLNDLKHNQDIRPESNAAKLQRALAYLRELNIHATTQGNTFRYEKAEHGSKVLRHLRRKAA